MSVEMWPYTNIHNLNLDWILEKIKEFSTQIGIFTETIEEYTGRTDQALITVQEKIDYIDNYFNNLDVQQEINNKLDDMSETGELARLLAPFVAADVPSAVTAWLNQHVTPTSPAIDNSLTITGAAADARVAGDGVLYGMKKHLYPADMSQGYWAGRQITTESRRICCTQLIDAVAGDVLQFSDNTNGLYWSFGIYEGSNTTASYNQQWTTAENASYVLPLTGHLYIQFATAGTAGASQDITPADLTLNSGVLTPLGVKVYDAAAMADIVNDGSTVTIRPQDLTQGYWQTRAIQNTPLRLCIGKCVPVKKGDVLAFHNNTNGLYWAFGIYVGDNITGSGTVAWTTGTDAEYTLQYDGLLYIQFANAATAGASTTIVPADLLLTCTISRKAISDNNYNAYKNLANKPTKKVAFLGDSITAGVGTNFCFHQYIGLRYGWTCYNYGYGGSGYVRNYPSTGGKMAVGETGMGYPITEANKIAENNFLARIASVPTEIDALVIFGGTNDWSHGDTISAATFTQTVNDVLDYAQTTFGKIPIIVLGPIHRLNDDVPNSTTNKTLGDYSDIVKNACRDHGIKFIDLFAESGLNPANGHNQELYFTRDDTSALDSIHPNHNGHVNMANIVGPVLNDLLY